MTSCMYLLLCAWNQALCEPLHLTKVYLTWHTLSSEAVHIFQSRRKIGFSSRRKGLMAARKRKPASHTPLTITDVARRAGVSRTAVSYVLNENGQRNKHVSDETRPKVLQTVQEFNFHPHPLPPTLTPCQIQNT